MSDQALVRLLTSDLLNEEDIFLSEGSLPDSEWSPLLSTQNAVLTSGDSIRYLVGYLEKGICRPR